MDYNSLLNNILRRLPDFKGKQRLVRLLFRKHISGLKNIIVNGDNNLKYKLPNAIENIGFEIFINGIYEKETSGFISSRIPANGIYMDVGANIGSIALPVCVKRKDITAVCIEASHRVFEYLEFNCKLNKIANVVLINNAIADKDKLQVEFISPIEQFGKGQISSYVTDDSESIATLTIDSLLKQINIEKVDFIKVDIQGYEYYAFKGAGDLLSKATAPDILFEFEDWAEESVKDIIPGDAQQVLFDFGFKLFKIMNNGRFIPFTKPLRKGSVMIFATKKNTDSLLC